MAPNDPNPEPRDRTRTHRTAPLGTGKWDATAPRAATWDGTSAPGRRRRASKGSRTGPTTGGHRPRRPRRLTVRRRSAIRPSQAFPASKESAGMPRTSDPTTRRRRATVAVVPERWAEGSCPRAPLARIVHLRMPTITRGDSWAQEDPDHDAPALRSLRRPCRRGHLDPLGAVTDVLGCAVHRRRRRLHPRRRPTDGKTVTLTGCLKAQAADPRRPNSAPAETTIGSKFVLTNVQGESTGVTSTGRQQRGHEGARRFRDAVDA